MFLEEHNYLFLHHNMFQSQDVKPMLRKLIIHLIFTKSLKHDTIIYKLCFWILEEIFAKY